MYEWSDEHKMIRDAVRAFVEAEVRPQREELEFGDTPPYDVIRKLYRTFGMDQMARDGFKKRLDAESTADTKDDEEVEGEERASGGQGGFMLLPIIELCRCSPGLVTAMGVSVGLAAGTIMSKGTAAQKERWALDLLTFDKVGAWAITEPDSGSDAFGRMQSTRDADGDEYILNGQKTFITNGPYADTTIFICKLDEGNPPAGAQDPLVRARQGDARASSRRSRCARWACTRRRPGCSSSTTCARARTVCSARPRTSRTARARSRRSRSSGPGSRRCRSASSSAASSSASRTPRSRVRFGKPIGEHQLIQEKLARMEVHRLNTENLVFRSLEKGAAGVPMDLTEASAMKLYTARAAMEVALEAVQLHGGNGYMAEFEVEQLARDAKVLQIYAGTDEIQISQIARSLLA